mgnify:FL=1|tara:strand:+ start:86 stop:298 length:213 start_codon:yes stop_codon:yes gene_type:complete
MSKQQEEANYEHYILRLENMEKLNREQLRARLSSLKEEKETIDREIKKVRDLLAKGNPPLIKVLSPPRLI